MVNRCTALTRCVWAIVLPSVLAVLRGQNDGSLLRVGIREREVMAATEGIRAISRFMKLEVYN